MNYSAITVLSLVGIAGAGSVARAQGLQDLLERKKDDLRGAASYETDLRVGRNRVDLTLAPSVRIPRLAEERRLGISTQADLRMICGQYDLKATFQHLLGKEAREEFLEGLPELLVQELVGSGMDLLCQAEPTLCNLLQNYSISANLKLGYYKDLCQAIEQAVVDAQRKNYASAVEACLREKQAQGYPLDRAIEICQKRGGQVTGFRGELVGELDLGRALREVLGGSGMSPGAEKLVDRLSESTRLTPSSMSSEIDPYAVAGLYEEIRQEYAARVEKLLEKASKREAISGEELAAAVPAGAPRVAEDEIRTLALLPAHERQDVVASLASAWALFELRRRIHEVERALEALRGAPTVDEGKRRLLEDRLDRLRNERRRFEEIHEDQARAADALVRAKALADREYGSRVAQVKSRVDLESKKRDLANSVRPWGSCPTAALPIQGSDKGRNPYPGPAATGTTLQYGFGSMGGPR